MRLSSGSLETVRGTSSFLCEQRVGHARSVWGRSLTTILVNDIEWKDGGLMLPYIG